MTFGKHLRLETGNQVNLTSGERRGSGDRIQLPMANDLISHAYVMQRRRWHPHSSTLVWKIPWTEEPGRLQSMGPLSQTRLSDFTFTFHFHALEKEMATRSSVLAWRIPGTVEPGGLPSWGRTESDTTEAT